ncbi:hypothetical protein PVAP13_7NG355372 [Panicum virgatum]|uniref:Uncharacterized protein n=1 Tax=Panicum virgatum TaxID=38727 RepID=A0A8T0Q0K9_PANVG|nr:hypothetical protein PVAP13_7NG355372 [Panicum virgatum]
MAPESCHLIRSACLPLRMSSLSTRGSFHLRALALDPCGSKASIASFLTPGAGGFLLTSSSGTLWRSTGPDQTDVEQLRRVSDFSDESLLIPPHSARCAEEGDGCGRPPGRLPSIIATTQLTCFFYFISSALENIFYLNVSGNFYSLMCLVRPLTYRKSAA